MDTIDDFWDAVKQQNIPKIEAFLSNSQFWIDNNLGHPAAYKSQALLYAAQNRNITLVRYLLDSSTPGGEHIPLYVSRALREISYITESTNISDLLKLFKVIISNYDNLIEVPVEDAFDNLFKTLPEVNPNLVLDLNIPTQYLSCAVKSLIKLNKIDCIQHIVEHYPTLNKESILTELVSSAFQDSRYYDTLRQILAIPGFAQIASFDNNALLKQFQNLADEGYENAHDIIAILLEVDEVVNAEESKYSKKTEQHSTESMALQIDDAEYVANISKDLISAALSGRIRFIEMLFAELDSKYNSDISKYSVIINQAFALAVKYQKFEVVDCFNARYDNFLDKNCIDSFLINTLESLNVFDADDHYFFEKLNSLLMSPTIQKVAINPNFKVFNYIENRSKSNPRQMRLYQTIAQIKFDHDIHDAENTEFGFLLHAAKSGNLKKFEHDLKQISANKSINDSYMNNYINLAFELAIYYNNANIIEYLVRHKSHNIISQKNILWAIWQFADRDNFQLVKIILDGLNNIAMKESLLTDAMTNSKFDLFRFLLSHYTHEFSDAFLLNCFSWAVHYAQHFKNTHFLYDA